MLSKSDYENYLIQMRELELDMMQTYQKCANEIKDKKIKKIFTELANSEKEHAQLVVDIADLICPEQTIF
ncbi:MAG: ferritin family protein [Candidatus Omnitrophota bacterium]